MKNILAFGASSSANSINKTFANYSSKQIPNSRTNLLDLNEFEIPCDFSESALNTVFLAEPKNSSIFSIYSSDGLQILAKKFFSKKYIKDHNFQKFTFVDFCNNFLHLFKKNLISKNKLKGEILVSKARFKLLRTK